jgi:aryl-alcohol dehydrogenase-like predicted oxidoreductase
MHYRQLGQSQLLISSIGFGCMSLGEDLRDNTYLIHRAVEAGINFFDTADLYDKGVNEQMLGQILKGKRENVLLATKVGNQWRSDGSGWDWNPRRAYILRAVEDSLRRLRTDYIDLYQLHGGTIEDPIDETIEAFELLQQQGKIRYYGISSIRPNVIKEWIKRSRMVSVMMQYSLLDRRPEEECLQLLKKMDIGVLVRGALAKGIMVDKPAVAYLDYTREEVEKMANAVGSHSGKGRKKSHVALQFVLRNSAVTSIITGLRTLSQLEDAVRTMIVPGLTEEEERQLRGVLPVNVYRDHR